MGLGFTTKTQIKINNILLLNNLTFLIGIKIRIFIDRNL